VSSIALIVHTPYDSWICRRKITTFEFGGAAGGRSTQLLPADEAKSRNEANDFKRFLSGLQLNRRRKIKRKRQSGQVLRSRDLAVS
jgi:hypothetical protein